MRRILVPFLSVVVLLGVVIAGAHTLGAQDADMASHPLVGSWDLAVDIGDGDTSCHSQVAFSADGTYIEASCEGFVSIGSWEPTGPTTANMSFLTGSPEDGQIRIRAAIEVAEDGQSFTAPFTFDLIDPETGTGMGEYGPGMATGTRLVVEGPGTPVGTILDLFAQFEASPEATPAA
jgi:hypothetical protein